MSQSTPDPDRLHQRLNSLKAKIIQLKAERAEPVAIVGSGCRLPGGVTDSEGLWQLLSHQTDALGLMPPDRWDHAPFYDPDPEASGKAYVQAASFTGSVEQFDPLFFGISPREAQKMDPQHRFILETAWEALEHAAIPPDRLAKTRTGVFVGIGLSEYASVMETAGADRTDAYAATGLMSNFAAGRLSYLFGLQGPSFVVDTACSSSLVAIHVACQSLRTNECDVALAGGVSLMLSPFIFVSLSRLRALAPDGRCKTFSAAADGYGRGEGCGMLVLKRLSSATADGDRILAVIRGSAVNHDGPSSGLTTPNGLAQQAVIGQALQAAQLTPADVDYVEAHGTGTPLGDPIELEALAAAYGPGRATDRPLCIGAVKANIGHLEAAAGVASVLKVVAALQHESLPAQPHAVPLSPYVAWDGLPLDVIAQARPWPAGERPRRAGVSAFGLSGTNAHLILEEAPASTVATTSAIERAVHLLPLSAKTPAALQDMAARYATHLGQTDQRLADVCHTAGIGRTHFEHRLAVVASSIGDARQKLEAAINGEGAAGLVTAPATRARRPQVAFLFTGQGSQFAGMGKDLYDTQPIFRTALDRCAEILIPLLDRPLLSVMWPEAGEDHLLHETVYTQPALFAFEYALAELWRSWGIVPDALMGHSVGEYVAACVAGVFSLEDGLTLIAGRGRLMQALPRDGAMASVRSDVATVTKAIASFAADVSIAGVNGPDQLVISGRTEAVRSICAELEAQGITTKALTVSHAFHSPLMDPLLDAFEAVVNRVELKAPSLPLISNVTGTQAGADVTTAAYWRQHLREAVQFATGMTTLEAMGITAYLEIGPQPILVGLGDSCIPDAPVTWLPSLRRNRDAWPVLLESLGHLYTLGAAVDWTGFDAPYARQRVTLPTYAFQRQRCWVETVKPDRTSSALESLLTTGSETDLLQQLGLAQIVPADEHAIVLRALQALRSNVEAEQVAGTIGANFYAPLWRSKPLRTPASSGTPGHWVVLVDERGIGEGIASAIETAGGRCTRVPRNHFGALTASSVAAWWTELLSTIGVPAGVLYLWALDGSDGVTQTAGDCRDHLLEMTYLVQAIAGHGGAGSRLWLLTQGAASVDRTDRLTSPAQTALWGLGRVVALEHRAIWAGMIDLPAIVDAASINMTLAQVLAGDGEDHIAVRAEGRFVQRLARHQPKPVKTFDWSKNGTVLITGGVGGLGLHVAQWLARQGFRHLVLTSRRGMDTTGAPEAVAALEALGAHVTVARADVADEAAMAMVVARIDEECPALTAVVHAAGSDVPTLLADLDEERLAAVVAPKIDGTLVLERLLRGRALQGFVCFSSIAAVWGSGTQAAYCAANAFLVGWAAARHAEGLPALCMNWGPWLDGGMLTAEGEKALARRGVAGTRPAQMLQALQLALNGDAVQVVVVDVDWPLFSAVYESAGPAPLLADMPKTGAMPAVVGLPAMALRLQSAAPDERPALMRAWLQSLVAEILGMADISSINPTTGFQQLGMDSLMAVEMRNRLRGALGLEIPVTVAFNYPTTDSLAAFLIDELTATWNMADAATMDAATLSSAETAIDAAQALALLENLQSLDDDEVDAVLRQLESEGEPADDRFSSTETRSSGGVAAQESLAGRNRLAPVRRAKSALVPLSTEPAELRLQRAAGLSSFWRAGSHGLAARAARPGAAPRRLANDLLRPRRSAGATRHAARASSLH